MVVIVHLAILIVAKVRKNEICALGTLMISFAELLSDRRGTCRTATGHASLLRLPLSEMTLKTAFPTTKVITLHKPLLRTQCELGEGMELSQLSGAGLINDILLR